MTRKDYQVLADSVRLALTQDASADTHPDGPYEGVMRVAKRLADTLAKDNPRFDRVRFLTACGLGVSDA